MFELIYEPSSIPLTLEEGYKRQNEILKKQIFLYTAFGGIKLDLQNNRYLPFIRKGSLCMFCYSLYEAKEHIILKDTVIRDDNNRYITLTLEDSGKRLSAKIVDSLDCYYNEGLGGFYKIEREKISKYIEVVITKEYEYYKINYFSEYNNEV